ncbi:hypothetical protein FCL40_09350 [Ferrimonas sediminicola]|uniref:Uncharacterized protein n=1 Tax=Ferrimonas sediminicola TaxID=2569538 RepID=A0A4U1BCS0_9GAMM|nr:hypothetical protein [Ferrimonas sediminicola]TKB48839.1 hypothetical protein FCL40_09350 [Ferrimonas sediminicola]
MLKEIEITQNEPIAAKEGLSWKQAQLTRFIEQNRGAQPVTASLLDELNSVESVRVGAVTTEASIECNRASADKKWFNLELQPLSVQSTAPGPEHGVSLL